jgi:predicted nucleotidyltransferase
VLGVIDADEVIRSHTRADLAEVVKLMAIGNRPVDRLPFKDVGVCRPPSAGPSC